MKSVRLFVVPCQHTTTFI